MVSTVTKRQTGSSTIVMLTIFFLLLCSVSTGLLYLEQRHEVSVLKEKVSKLQSSQVLLMVPDEQAKALASWLEAHPEAAANLIKQAKPGRQTKVVIDPDSTKGSSPSGDNRIASSKGAVNPEAADKDLSSVTISEDEMGVKIIRLANGGVLVTTRDVQ
ncbi:membrane anchored protein in chemotaxis locus [Shewanella sp. AS1]|uniref:membrane anchored protein in chemotaxis locus n=1 Tax=Shewanella sp. AS1 TaxID=2907626 RepID=UPI001F3A8FCD|nr:membrane anchored protein in chemotaxis locus [Shewanella sp. AS1]MCE9680039.1 membrane anchored protein in chemotaxis locus [Shewanella sp. AS1]